MNLTYSVLYVLHVEVFPTQILNISFTIGLTMGRAAGALTPFLAEIPDRQAGLMIMVGIALLGFFLILGFSR